MEDAKEVLKHHEAIQSAKGKGDTHSEHGIHVDDHHHILKQIKNTHAKLEDSSQRIMLHQNHTELSIQKRQDKNKRTDGNKSKIKQTAKQKKQADWEKFIKDREKLDKEKMEKEWAEDDKRDAEDNKKPVKKKTILKPQKKETEKSIQADIKKRGYVTFGDQEKLDKISEEETEEGIRGKIKERGYATFGDSEKLEKIFDQRKKDIDKWKPTVGKHALVPMNGMHITHPHKTNEYAKLPLDDALEKAAYLSKHDIVYKYLPRPSVHKKGTYDIARVPKSEVERIKISKSKKK